MNDTVDIEKDGAILSREFEVCEESEIDFAEIDEGRVIKRNFNGKIVDDDSEQNGQYYAVSNEEINEAINFRKWSRYSSVSQSTDATIMSVSTNFEIALENIKPTKMSILALDNLSKLYVKIK